MNDANHNQPDQNPAHPEYVQSVFTFQMDPPIDPSLTDGQSNSSLQPTTQPSPPRSFPPNMGQIQNPNSQPTFPSSNAPYHSSIMAAQNNPNMSVLGNGNGIAPASRGQQAFNAQSSPMFSQNPPQSSARQSIAATQANLYDNMANMAAQQATQQHQPPSNGFVNHNLGGYTFMGVAPQTHAPTSMQYGHHQQPADGMTNQLLGRIPSSFDFSLVRGAASHYNNGSFHNNPSFRPDSMPTLPSHAPQPPVTSFPMDPLSRAAENMHSQLVAETAKKGSSNRATSQTPASPQEANPAQPPKAKRKYTKKPKGEATADPTAPQEPPKKRQRAQKKNLQTTAPVPVAAVANAPVAPMAVMSTATSKPTFTPSLLSSVSSYDISPATQPMRQASGTTAPTPSSGHTSVAPTPVVQKALNAIGTFQPVQSFTQATCSASVSHSVPHNQVSQPSSQPPIFNMAPPPHIQVPSEFATAASSTPIPALSSAPSTHAVKQTPANFVQKQAPVVPNKVTPVPVPNIPTVAKVPSVFPRHTPGTTPSPPTVPTSTQAMSPGPARTQAPVPTPAPSPAPTPARVSPQHASRLPTQSTVGPTVQRAPNAAFTPSPSPAPARSPPQSFTQGQNLPPARLPVQLSSHVTAQLTGQYQTQASVQQPIQNASQQQPQNALQQPPHQHAAQNSVQQPGQQQVQLEAPQQALQQTQEQQALEKEEREAQRRREYNEKRRLQRVRRKQAQQQQVQQQQAQPQQDQQQQAQQQQGQQQQDQQQQGQQQQGQQQQGQQQQGQQQQGQQQQGQQQQGQQQQGQQRAQRTVQEAQNTAAQHAKNTAQQQTQHAVQTPAQYATPQKAQQYAQQQAQSAAQQPIQSTVQHAVQSPAQRIIQQSAQNAPQQPAHYDAHQQAQKQASQRAYHTAQREAHQKAQREAQQKAQEEAQQKAQQEAQLKAQLEAQEKARQQAAYQQAQLAAQQKAQEEAQLSAQQKAQQEAQLKAQLEAQEEAQLAAQQKAQEEARQQAAYQQAQLTAQQKAQQEAQLKAQLEAQEEAQLAAQQKAQEEAQLTAQQKAQEQAQKEAQEKAQEQAKKQALQEAQRAAQPAPAPPIPNFTPSPLSETVTPTIISLQADTDLYCVFDQQTLHHFRVRRSTLTGLRQTDSLKTTSPFPNLVYINFNEALTTPGATPNELSNLPGETADSHMQALSRLLRLLEDPAAQGKIPCNVETIWRLANLQPALGLDKEFVRWLRQCMALFISDVTTVPDSTGGNGSVNSHWMSQAMVISEDMFGKRDLKGADVKKNRWEKALEACRKWTWIVEWRDLCARLAYLCAVDKDAQGRFVLKKPGRDVGVLTSLNRVLVGEMTIDTIVNTRTQACRYLLNVAETTYKNWQGRISNGQKNGGCRSKECMDKRTGGLAQVVRGIGLHIPKGTKTTTSTSTTGASNGSNKSSLEAHQAQPQPAAAPVEPTFHGQGTKMTNGLPIHTVFDIMKAIENKRRGQYTLVDAILETYGGKCYECMKGSAVGPGELNPTNSLFPVIDLLYEMLWDMRVKFMEWTECPWVEKLVLKGIEDPAVKERLQAVVGGGVGVDGADLTMGGT